MPMKLVVLPFSFECGLPHFVIEYALTVHLVFLELSLIIGTVLIDKLSLAMLTSIESHTFVSPTIFVGFNGKNKLRLSVFLHHKL